MSCSCAPLSACVHACVTSVHYVVLWCCSAWWVNSVALMTESSSSRSNSSHHSRFVLVSDHWQQQPSLASCWLMQWILLSLIPAETRVSRRWHQMWHPALKTVQCCSKSCTLQVRISKPLSWECMKFIRVFFVVESHYGTFDSHSYLCINVEPYCVFEH